MGVYFRCWRSTLAADLHSLSVGPNLVKHLKRGSRVYVNRASLPLPSLLVYGLTTVGVCLVRLFQVHTSIPLMHKFKLQENKIEFFGLCT